MRANWPGKDGKVDTGIDLVAWESYGGGFCAIQCKFFDPAHAIQNGDIDSFFTASDAVAFGSVARDEDTPRSDLDDVVDQEGAGRLSPRMPPGCENECLSLFRSWTLSDDPHPQRC